MIPFLALGGLAAVYLGFLWLFDRFPHEEVTWPYLLGGTVLAALFVFLGLSESKIENMLKLVMALFVAWIGWDYLGPAGQAVLLAVPLGMSSAIFSLFA